MSTNPAHAMPTPSAKNPPKFDVIIPCYNAADTLADAIDSVLLPDNRVHLGDIWIIDDASTDQTAAIIDRYCARFADAAHHTLHQIYAHHFRQNLGVATARNVGAMLARADYVAFLDADDSYQEQSLAAYALAFTHWPNLGGARLPMQPIGLPKKYQDHPNFAHAWHYFEMTAASNTAFYRPFFLALGGYPTDALFKRWGGEDGALGLAAIDSAQIAYLAAQDGSLELATKQQFAVNYHCRETMHARFLLDALLFGDVRAIDAVQLAQADATTASKIADFKRLIAMGQETGKRRLVVS